MTKLSSGAIVFFTAFAAIPALADITIGVPANSNNCYPFGCSYSGEYQQVYNQGQFAGPVSITGVKFFNTLVDEGATAMNSGNWTISLSSTAADWNTLSSVYANNIGAGNTQVFSGNLAQPWAFGDTLFIQFTTPFTYNPGSGNLLMDVQASGVSSSGSIFFDAQNGNTDMGRAFNFGGNPAFGTGTNAGFGLTTDFVTTSATPEPTLLFPLAAGLGLAGFLKVRRNRRAQG
jgi:hypothetical protein